MSIPDDDRPIMFCRLENLGPVRTDDPQKLPAAWRDGWAIVELMGHVTEAGYVTAESYGAAVLFRCESPSLPAELMALPEYGYIAGKGWFEKGTRYKTLEVQARTVLIGAAAIYRLRPCSEVDARKELASREDYRSIEILESEPPIETGDQNRKV